MPNSVREIAASAIACVVGGPAVRFSGIPRSWASIALDLTMYARGTYCASRPRIKRPGGLDRIGVCCFDIISVPMLLSRCARPLRAI